MANATTLSPLEALFMNVVAMAVAVAPVPVFATHGMSLAAMRQSVAAMVLHASAVWTMTESATLNSKAMIMHLAAAVVVIVSPVRQSLLLQSGTPRATVPAGQLATAQLAAGRLPVGRYPAVARLLLIEAASSWTGSDRQLLAISAAAHRSAAFSASVCGGTRPPAHVEAECVATGGAATLPNAAAALARGNRQARRLVGVVEKQRFQSPCSLKESGLATAPRGLANTFAGCQAS